MANRTGTMKKLTQKKVWFLCAVIMVLLYVLFRTFFYSNVQEKKYQWITLQPQDAVISVHKYGKVVTGHNMSIAAPFEGKILKTYYTLGGRIEIGDKLITLSTDQVIKKKHLAESDYLQKHTNYNKYLNWATSSEVQRAKQEVLNAEQQLKIELETLEDNKLLYKNGIVSRDEFEQQQQIVQQSKQQILTAKLSLQDILKQGNKNNLTIKRLAMMDAKSTLNMIENKLQHATITAMVSGIALKPLKGSKDGALVITEGEVVTENQNLLTIGNSDHLEISGRLAQEEINKVTIGMQAAITSDTFPGVVIFGKVMSISRVANTDGSAPMFPFKIALDPIAPKIRRLMRIGILVDINLEVYHKMHAIVVPIRALHSDAKGEYVFVKHNNGSVKRYVKHGPTLINGIVILEKLKKGDKIQVPTIDTTHDL